MSVSSRKDSEKETIQRRGLVMSIQEECLWSNTSGQGLGCINTETTNATSKISDELALSDFIASAIEEKYFDEDIQVMK